MSPTMNPIRFTLSRLALSCNESAEVTSAIGRCAVIKASQDGFLYEGSLTDAQFIAFGLRHDRNNKRGLSSDRRRVVMRNAARRIEDRLKIRARLTPGSGASPVDPAN